MLFRSAWLFVAVTMSVGLAAASHADDWGNMAAISSTLGVHGDRVCVGEATRGDIGCPTYAPQILTDGTVSASRFAGDGSGLTGVVASTADRIVSGSTSLLAVSGTGFVSLTQAGTNTGWFDPTRGLVTLGVSSTGPISGTSGYFTGPLTAGAYLTFSYPGSQSSIYLFNRQLMFTSGSPASTVPFAINLDTYRVGINGIGGSLRASTTLHVLGGTYISSWTSINFGSAAYVTPTAPLEVSGTVSATRFVGDGSGLTNVTGAITDRLVSGTSGITAYQDSSLTFSTAGSNRMIIGQNGYVGLGNFGGTVTPTAELHISSTRVNGAAPYLLIDAGKSYSQGPSAHFNRSTSNQQAMLSFGTGNSSYVPCLALCRIKLAFCISLPVTVPAPELQWG